MGHAFDRNKKLSPPDEMDVPTGIGYHMRRLPLIIGIGLIAIGISAAIYLFFSYVSFF